MSTNEQLLSAIDDLLDAAENFASVHESYAKACDAEKAALRAPAAPAAPVAVPLTDADILFLAPCCPVESDEQLIRFARDLGREYAARWGVKLEGGEA